MAEQNTSASTGATVDQLLDPLRLAELLGVSHRTLEDWRLTGSGPPFIRISGRCIRYSRADVEAWIEERRRLSTSDSGEAA